MDRIAKNRCGYSAYICKGIPRLMQNMYKNVVLNSCPEGTEQAALASPWYNFYNIPVIIRIYDTSVAITNLYGKVPRPPNKLQTCSIIYNRESQDYFTVAQFINAQQPSVLKPGCYKASDDSNKQHIPGILDPAHAIPDIQVPQIQVPTMVPKVDVQVQVDSAMAAPLAYYAEALGAGTTAIDMSMNHVCKQLELLPRLSSYTDTSCTYTILGTDSARALPISLYGVRYSGQGKYAYAVVKKIQNIAGSTMTGRQRRFTVNEGQTSSIYIYYKIIRTFDGTKDTYNAQLHMDTSMPRTQFGEIESVNKLIATVTMSRSKAQDSTNVLQSPQVGGLNYSSSTRSFGYQLDDINDSWLAQAFDQWNAVVNQKLTFSGRCSASITYHVCGQLIVYQSQFGHSTQATPEQLKQFAIPAVMNGGHRVISAKITPEGSAQGQSATNSLLTLQQEGDKVTISNLKPTSNTTCQILNYNSGVLTLTPVSATAQGSFTILSCGNTGLTVIQAPLAATQGESIILGANNSSMISIALPKEATTSGYALAWDGSAFYNSAVVSGPTNAGYYVALGGQTTGGDITSVVNWSKVGVLPADEAQGIYWVKSSGGSDAAYALIKVTVPADKPQAGHFLQVTQSDSSIQFKYVDAEIPITSGQNQVLSWDGSKFQAKTIKVQSTDQILPAEATPDNSCVIWTGKAWSTRQIGGGSTPPNATILGYAESKGSYISYSLTSTGLIYYDSTGDGSMSTIGMPQPDSTRSPVALGWDGASFVQVKGLPEPPGSGLYVLAAYNGSYTWVAVNQATVPSVDIL